MTPSQWQRVRDVFEAIVDLDPAEARRKLEEEVRDDPAVRAEISSLLDHHSRAGAFLAAPPALELLGIGVELEPGTSLGPYTVVRDIGQGGMGRVYLATDTRLQRQVCLKAVRSDLAGDTKFRERLRREAQLAASLGHPGICAVHALEEFDGCLYLVTEFVEGQTLREEIESGRRPAAQDVMNTMKELAEALGAAHARGIAHCDLKPENVMRSADGRLKILDFGLARVEAESTPQSMAGVPAGTPAYMAPEQISGGPTDRRTDLFALGVLIYEYATGARPFAARTPLETAARILEREPAPLEQARPDLPSTFIEAVERCLQKNPAARFATARELITALAVERPGRRRRRPATVWWRLHQLAIVTLYLVACVVAWLFKEWEPLLVTRWIFVLIGVLSTVSGVVRGHLLFTERMHFNRLAAERQKTRAILRGLDLAIALALVAVASLVAPARPVAAVLVMGLAAGIGTAAVFIEPATAAAAFDPS